MKLNKKGFTLAELLIVVAIIAVLVAIAIPVFTTAVNKAEVNKDIANVRAYVAEQVVSQMSADTWGADGNYTVTVSTAAIEGLCADGHIEVADHTVTATLGAATQTFTIDSDITVGE